MLERAAGHACGPYRVPMVDILAEAAYTNNPPCGAMRGFGANQANFAIEGCMDQLAEKVGINCWEIRWRNAVDVGDMLCTGQVLEKSVGIKRTLSAVRDRYDALRAEGRAVGIACGIKNSGLGNGAKEWGRARLRVESNSSVTLFGCYTEMGQGLLTISMQIASEGQKDYGEHKWDLTESMFPQRWRSSFHGENSLHAYKLPKKDILKNGTVLWHELWEASQDKDV